MSEQLIDSLEALLANGRDDALLRFSLGNAHLNRQHYTEAIEHLARAVEQDPHYSAAWKLYGKALATAGKNKEATAAYRQGIETAERNGDIQAAKEMKVFLKRLEP